MSVSDPHLVCLWCLGSDHDSRACADCKSMHPKAICEWTMKLLAARHKKACVVPVSVWIRGVIPSPVMEPFPWTLVVQVKVR